ncbi:hypothetical protein D3C75_1100390 [compost metagenome]
MLNEGLYRLAVQLAEAESVNLTKYGDQLLLGLIDPVRGHGAVNIGHGSNLGIRVKIIFGQVMRVPGTIFTFMMLKCRQGSVGVIHGITDNFIAINRM